ncbi:MAG: MFS transporter [Thermoplasmataceae archaeon]
MEWRGVGLVYYAGGFVLTAFSGNLIFFLVVMSIMTIGEDFLAPTTQTIITTLSPADKRGTYIGMYNLVTSFGAFLGAIIGLFLLSYLSEKLSEFWFIFAAGTFVVAMAYLFMGKSYRRRVALPQNIRVWK